MSMASQAHQVATRVLSGNLGNRLTEELILGISLSIHAELLEAERKATSAAAATEAPAQPGARVQPGVGADPDGFRDPCCDDAYVVDVNAATGEGESDQR